VHFGCTTDGIGRALAQADTAQFACLDILCERPNSDFDWCLWVDTSALEEIELLLAIQDP